MNEKLFLLNSMFRTPPGTRQKGRFKKKLKEARL